MSQTLYTSHQLLQSFLFIPVFQGKSLCNDTVMCQGISVLCLPPLMGSTYHGAVWTCPKSHPRVGSLLPTLTTGAPWFWDRGVHPGALLGRPSGLNTCWREREGKKQNGAEEEECNHGAPARASVNPLGSSKGGVRQLILEVKWSESCSDMYNSLWPCEVWEFSRPEYWRGYPLPSPGDHWTQVSHIAGGFFAS